MKLTVLGAGAVGTASAVLAVSRGHAVTLWSPRGGGTHGIGATLQADGALAGTARVAVAVDAGRALAEAEAVLVAVPPHALGPVLRRVAPMLQGGVPVFLAPSQSLAPLLLDRLLAARGVAAPVAALSMPPVSATRTGADSVRILALAPEVELACVPAAGTTAAAAVAAALFGATIRPVANMLGAIFANHEPVLQAPLALANLTRIETGEVWDRLAQMTPAVCRMTERLDAERLAVARAWGHAPPALPRLLARATGVAEAPLREMAAAIRAAQGPQQGPQGLDATHLAEGVTYGLGLWLRLAAPLGVPVPLTAGVVEVLEALWGRELRADDLMEGLDLGRLPALLRDGHPR